jgi:predicted Rossmann fold nucleotide-binding protein DprA/Smf involved in DNA uptake
VHIKNIQKSDSEYPPSLTRYLAEAAPESAATIGSLKLLNHSKLAIFCSSICPADILSATEQVLKRMVVTRMAIISGFHSDAEKRCLQTALDSEQPIILSPARSLDKLRIRPEFKSPLDNGRLLFLSFFRSHRHRSDIEMAFKRNLYVAALADRVLIVHASPSSKTEQLCREIIGWQKPVYTISNEANQNLVRLGAKVTTGNDVGWVSGLIVE